jgi:3-oxoacyl-[acyl-carrier protein] reductase
MNDVCSGYARTACLDDLAGNISSHTGVKPEEVFANRTRLIPAGCIDTPEEFASVVAFLASGRAGYVNGTSIAVDGGALRSLF